MRFLFTTLLLVLFTNCYTPERNCNDFKTGTFEFTYTINGVEKTGRFTRTNDLNIDYYENTIDTASVRWINDCEFIMKKLHPKNKSEEKAIHMKILSTTKNSYVFEYKLAVKDPYKKNNTERGVAKKIN
ncbi:hypothetical protein [Ichthyenterobacterium magnum]|uniref:DNA topoisomerase IV n=1 Tax=Ichthyenterobacterium magnum TaxID=1230530 RepID=A0A420DLW5_9FLAO|nr:hypothetical protein [Ichthyenterobacterium magnum]RKE95284.1 hypothetical protein BXY80_1471 [Ichthyenterobacterium magnum]